MSQSSWTPPNVPMTAGPGMGGYFPPPTGANPGQPKVITTRQYRAECVSCQGSGLSQRVTPGTTNFEQCKGCDGKGAVSVTETTMVQ